MIKSRFLFLKTIIGIISFFTVLNANAQWSNVGTGSCDIVYALSPDVPGTGIYMAMKFGNPCPNAARNYLQHWNGSAWSNVHTNCYVNGYIYAIAVSGNNIYVGGNFTTANGGAGYNRIACWNTITNTWSTLGTGMDATVYALSVDATSNTLFVGGEFTTANGTTVNRVAAWNIGSSTWAAMGGTPGVSGVPAGSPPGEVAGVYALTICANKVYAGGRFTTVGATTANNIAAWDIGSSTWSVLASGGQTGVTNVTVVNPANIASAVWDAPVMALTNNGSIVYVGGDFDKAGGSTGYQNIGAWNTGSSAWSKLGTLGGMTWPGLGTSAFDNTFGDNANVYSLTMYNGDLIAGGDMMHAGGVFVNYFIARWNGTAWQDMTGTCGGAVESDVFALTVSNGILYAGGQFPEDVPNTPANMWYVAQYSGSGPTITLNVGSGATICKGSSVGLSASGATSYTWSTGTGLSCTVCSNPTASPTSTTVYTVTATANGCNSTKTVTVTVTPNPTITVNSPSICSGQSTVLTASTATSYSWSTGATTNTISVSPPVGTTVYTVTGTSSGCSTVNTATVTVTSTPTLSISGTNTLCTGSSVVLTGGTAGSYTWSPGGLNTSTVSVSPGAGSTTYTLTGANGTCTATTAITVTATATPTLTVNSPSICSGNSTTLTASSATSYSWDSGATTNTISVSPSSTTVYTVTGTNGACSVVKTATVTVTTTPTLSITGTNTLCTGGSVVLTGGTAGSYTWMPGNISTSTISVNPSAGTTTYTLTGANGACTATTAITVTATATPTLTVNSPSICSGQSAVLTAATASSYSWSTGASTNTISVSPVSTTVYTVTGDNGNGCTVTKTATVNVTATPSLSITGASPICSGQSLVLSGGTATSYTWLPGGQNSSTISITPPAGTNTYTLQGANGTCTASTTAFVDVSPTPTIAIAGNSPICSGQSIVLSGGGASTYTWSANAGGVHTSTVSVSPGSSTVYTLSGTVGTCTSSNTATVTVNPTPTLTMSTNSYTLCNGSSTAISAGGASTYTWSNAGGLSCTVCATPTANPGSTTVYTVSGTSGSCVSAPATVTVNVNALPTITASGANNTICSSTSTTLSAGGASSYTWSPGGATTSTLSVSPGSSTVYTVVGTDNNGCINNSTVSITVAPTPTMSINAIPNAICAGQSVVLNGGTATTYTWSSNAGSANTATVSVTPGATDTYTLIGTIGTCTASSTVTVPVNPVPVIGTASVTGAPCGQSTGCINTVPVSGGTPTYTYSWNGGAGSSSSQYCNQPAGTYVLVVTDANGCQATQNVSIPNINGPTAPAVAATPTAVCQGDSLVVSVSNPQAGVTYTWTDITGTHSGTTYTISNISPGGPYNISVTATDNNGCVSAGTVINVQVNDNPGTVVSGTDHFCKNSTTVLNASPTGGNYSYQWTQNGSPISGATSSSYTASTGGNYGVVITNNSTGCKAASLGNYTVTVDSLPVIDTTGMTISASGCNQSTGSVINVTVTPNASSTTYTWTNGSGTVVGTGINLGNVPAGNYCLQVADSNNCKSSVCGITVNNAGAPNITLSASANNLCSGQTTTLTVSGAPSYTWQPGGATTNTLVVTPGSTTGYTVTADSLGCTTQQVLTVTVTATPTVTAGTSQNTLCSTQSATLTAGGATTYTWSSGASTASTSVSPTVNTTYTVIGQNGNCSDTATVSISVTPTPTISIAATGTAICSGQSATLTASGAANYTWQPTGATTPSITDTPGTSTVYTVTGDNAGCTSTQQISVTVNPTPTVSASNGNQIACSGAPVNGINFTTNGTTINWSNSNTATGISAGGAGNINGYTAPTVTATQTGIITVTPIDTTTGCTGATQDYTVTIHPNPQATGGSPDSATCGNSNGSVTGITASGGTPGYTYQWYDSNGILTGDTSASLNNIGAGTYSVLITDANGCVAPASQTTFTVGGSPAVMAAITPPVSQGQAPLNVTFGNTTSGATVYNWNFGNGQTSTAQNPSAVTYNTPGTYTVSMVANNGGCRDTSYAIVIIDVPTSIIIPNVYSPNGDGINDTWFITSTGYCTLHCDIYNRWGQLVYQLQGINDSWNGVMNNGNHATEGTYYFILQATSCIDGKPYKADGYITLVK